MSGKKRPTLGLVTMVKNEEAVLGRCLESVAGIVDEVVIVDTGSTDGTKEVAAAFLGRFPGIDGGPGLHVVDFEWCDDFSAPRNFGLEKSSADWILQLDADEELGLGAEGLPDLLRDKYHWAYQVRVAAAADAASLSDSTETFLALRLFRRRPEIRYKHIIHEQIDLPEHDRIAPSPLLIVHFGPSLDPRSDRPARNISLLKKAIEERPGDPFFLASLGNEYFLMQEFGPAYEAYEQAAKSADPELIYVIAMYRNMVLCLYRLDRKDEAFELLARLEGEYPDYTDLVYLEGILALSEGDLVPAADAFLRCLRMGDPPVHYHTWGGTGSYKVNSVIERLKGGKVPSAGSV